MSTYALYSPEQLVALLADDDDHAFTELYRRYWEKLLFIAGKKLKNIEEAENIVQDVFLDIWVRRQKLKINEQVEGYLAVAVRYKIINLLAKKFRDAESNQLLLQCADKQDNSLQDKFLSKELEEWLWKKASALPERCSMVFALRQQGVSNMEIARQMAISEKTVEMHVSRALKSLRATVKEISLLPLIHFIITLHSIIFL